MTSSPDGSGFEKLPEEIMFSITRASNGQSAARLGMLKIAERKTIETPHYIGITSRGVVAHLSQDNFAKLTDIRGVYMALEDFIEKPSAQEPPIYRFKSPGSSPLRRYTGLPDESVLILGARRAPPIPCPGSSTDTSLSIFTSIGFRQLPTKEFSEVARKLQPDIIVGLGDIPYGVEKVSKKKTDKITDRTTKWMLAQVKDRREDARTDVPKAKPLLFAPLLPLPSGSQSWYLEHLADEMQSEIQGLALYDASTLEDIPSKLRDLPRLGFTEPKNPNALLYEISRGMDVMTIPFIGAATDAGIALDFCFPVGNDDVQLASITPKPLGIDMWQTVHAVNLSPLSPGCSCYACSNHHRAYLQHLLMAKEMLGWVLLQIHNHDIMDRFFDGVRKSIARGSLEQDMLDFRKLYEPELPAKTGQGPRVRGYQFKSGGPNEPKKNPVTFKNMNDAHEKLAEATPPTPGADADDLEARGFADKMA